MARTCQPARAPNKALYLTDYARSAWDIGALNVAKRLAMRLSAPLFATNYSRLVIDCNRPPAAASSIPRLSEATTIPGNEAIARDAAELRRREIFDPYHRRIGEAIDNFGGSFTMRYATVGAAAARS